MVNPYNGPAAKLLTPPTLTLVKMTITGHHMVIQSLPKIALAPTPGDTITSYPKFAKVTYSTLPFCLCPCLSK